MKKPKKENFNQSNIWIVFVAAAVVAFFVLCAMVFIYVPFEEENSTLRYFIFTPLIVVLIFAFIGTVYLTRKNYNELKIRDEKFKIAISQLNSLTFEYDIEHDRVEFLDLTGNSGISVKERILEHPEFLGDRFGDVTEESREKYREMVLKIKAGEKSASCTLEIRHGNEPSGYYSVQVTGVADDRGNPHYALGTINDVTKKTEFEKSLNEKMNKDILTGLLNRVSFQTAVENILSDEVGKRKTHAFVVLDVDNFKQINDTYGHLIGDVLLQKIANIFHYIFPKTDLASRFGGDEFIVFMNDIASAKVALSRVKTISEELENLTLSNDINEKFSVSMGISFCPNDGDTFSELYGKADAALYRAKHFSGNSFVVYDSFNESDSCRVGSAKRVEGVGASDETPDAELDLFYREVQSKSAENKDEVLRILRAALGNHEIEPYLQPKFTAKSLVPHSAEMLARWNSPRYGLLSPNRFIPLFEKFNLIEEHDLYMLHEACLLLKEWKSEGKRLIPVSVNQSPNLMLRRGYLDIVVQELSENGVPPEFLTIEITERAVFSSYRVITKVVRSLTEFGVRVSLDDFGSGYTSLNMLKNLYVGELKIDKQFIDRLSFQKQRSHIIIKHIVALAKEMGIETTMEGVETAEQAEFIVAVGCDTLQGYLFAKPMSAKRFKEKYLTDEVKRLDVGRGTERKGITGKIDAEEETAAKEETAAETAAAEGLIDG